ncbi:MAG: copper chaperone PCu(A)C [Thermodesulfobacteriota bacterium]
MNKIVLLSILFFTLAQFSYADDNIVINDAWVREVPPGSSVSAVYMTIENKGVLDQLVSISSEIAETAELHTSKVDENGVATMEMIKVLNLPSDSTVKLEPGGMHIMLIDLKESLVGKEAVNIKLVFDKAGIVVVEVPVKKTGQMDHQHHHHH